MSKRWVAFNELEAEELTASTTDILLSPSATVGQIEAIVEHLARDHPRLKKDLSFRRLVGAIRHLWTLKAAGVRERWED